MDIASGGLFKNAFELNTALTSSYGANGIPLSETYASFITRVLGEDSSIDTGAIDGSYVTSGSPMNGTSVVKSNGTYSANPLANFGWSQVIWPDDMPDAGGALPGKTQVVNERDGTLQGARGTLLLHSGLVGNVGRITISGDEKLVLALGFAEIQSARNTVYDISITDAHSGKLIKSGVRVSGNTIYGELHENIDIRLTDNFAIDVDAARLKLNGYGTFDFSANGRDGFVVHIAADSAVFQIGANEGEGIFVSFGDAGSSALGVDVVSVRDRDLAARAVTVIDNAISKVSVKRARLGAYQNRLEHTITNLTTAATNTTAAESGIRDADMAKEMVEFTKLNILGQAGNSMLAQANQLPQAMLQLLR
jgi:flagellin